MKNLSSIYFGLLLAAITCLAARWFDLFSTETNNLLGNKIFYVVLGAGFAVAAQSYPNPTHRYMAYAAAALCIIGAFLSENLSVLKTIGLLAGVLLSFFAMPRRSWQ